MIPREVVQNMHTPQTFLTPYDAPMHGLITHGLIAILALATGCGFTTGTGQGSPSDDARPSSDGNPGTDAVIDAVIDQMPGAQCPIDYAEITSASPLPSRYRFVATGATWIAAENDCADDATSGGLATHLVVLDGAAEATAMIGGSLNIDDQWIGATDLKSEKSIEYVTTQSTTLSLSQSMNADNKDCIRIQKTAATEFRACGETNKYVCECDGLAEDRTRFPNLPNGNGD